MDVDQAGLGPRTPLAGTPPRSPGSTRRTSNIDTVRPEGAGTTRVIEGRARDVSTGSDGAAEILGSVRLRANVDARTYELGMIATDPPDERLDDLLGATVGPGFRRRIAERLDGPADLASLTRMLLDDMTGAQLVAGYDVVQSRPDGRRPVSLISVADLTSRADLCAGWATGGSLLEGIHRTSEVPAPVGPPAPRLESPDDEVGWHEMAPLPPGGMRRRRRLDVQAATGSVHGFEAHFRDSHMSDDGEETVLHEYRLTGTVDARRRTLVSIEAEAPALPYAECPNALGSADRVVGWTLDDLRRTVHRQLVGTSSCTHLNDTLRSLCDLDLLLDRVAPS